MCNLSILVEEVFLPTSPMLYLHLKSFKWIIGHIKLFLFLFLFVLLLADTKEVTGISGLDAHLFLWATP